MNLRRLDSKQRLTVCVLISFLLIGIVAYYPVLNSFFLSDDFAQIGKILDGDFSPTWGLEQGGFFRPLFILSYVIDSKLWGRNPVGYHLTNTVYHSINSFLVFVLAIQLTRFTTLNVQKVYWFAGVAGVLFLVLPSHTEAVSWISGRGDVIATTFSLLSVISYLGYRRGRSLLLPGALICFALALLTKESAVCVPLVILAIEVTTSLDRNDIGSSLKKPFASFLLFLAVLAIYAAVRFGVLGTFVGGYGTSYHLDFRLSVLWNRLPRFLLRSIFPPVPEELSPILLKPLKSWIFILLFVLGAGILTFALIYRNRRWGFAVRREQNRFLLLLLVAWLVCLLPVVTMSISVFDVAGERWIYLPSVFTCIALAYICVAFFPENKRFITWTLLLVVFYSLTLYRSNRTWNEAAKLSSGLLNDLVVSSRQNLLILNVPDNLNGATVFRNGIEQALKNFQNKKHIGRVDVVAFHSIKSPYDRIETTKEFERLKISLTREQDAFVRVNDKLACVKTELQSQRSLDVQLNNCPGDEDLFSFSGGRMWKLP